MADADSKACTKCHELKPFDSYPDPDTWKSSRCREGDHEKCYWPDRAQHCKFCDVWCICECHT